ncbi:MAG: hypothetical protein JW888_11375 [Pirellulales bacterium]|nr:hypothetical protein [Pirellulales bacterium]
MSHGQIADDEVLYRRIPPGKSWFQPPDRISSFNFKLRSDELGVSVYRAAALTVQEVLKKPEAIPGSGVAVATAGQIRALQNGKGDLLKLEVVPVNDENDPGHAEIHGPNPGVISSSAANALRTLFNLVEPPSMSS